MRNVLAHAGKQGRRVVAAFIATAFAQEDADMARLQWRVPRDRSDVRYRYILTHIEISRHI
jgi:transposase-like protein